MNTNMQPFETVVLLEARVLYELKRYDCIGALRTTQSVAELMLVPKEYIKVALVRLRNKGFVVLEIMPFSSNGEARGSGYRLSKKGSAAVSAAFGDRDVVKTKPSLPTPPPAGPRI